jgi:hypothetical protein
MPAYRCDAGRLALSARREASQVEGRYSVGTTLPDPGQVSTPSLAVAVGAATCSSRPGASSLGP